MTFIWDSISGLNAAMMTTFCFYPFRDLVKDTAFPNNLQEVAKGGPDYFVQRYKGMLLNPSQPLLISLPLVSMWGSYGLVADVTGSAVPAALVAGAVHGMTKSTVGQFARRMGSTNEVHNRSLLSSLQFFTKKYGVWSWCAGYSVYLMSHTLWFGGILYGLGRSLPAHQTSMLTDFIIAVQCHWFYSFVSMPIRNGYRSSLYMCKEAKLFDASQLLSYEKSLVQEGANVIASVAKERGVMCLLEGSFKMLPKSSVPFALMFTVYRSWGNSLTPSGRQHGPPPGIKYFGWSSK